MRQKTYGFATLILLLGSACVPTSESPTESRELLATGNEELETENSAVRLLIGYDPLYDKARKSCLKAAGEGTFDKKLIEVSDLDGTLNLLHVSSREALAKELGVDLGLNVRYGIANGSGSLNFLDNFSEKRNSINVLAKVTSDYAVTYHGDVELAGDTEKGAAAALAKGASAFQNECGATYARGVRYGARFYQLIVFEAKNEDAARKLKGELGVKAGTTEGPGGVDVSAAFHNDKELSKEGIDVTIHDTVVGFTLPKKDPANPDAPSGSRADTAGSVLPTQPTPPAEGEKAKPIDLSLKQKTLDELHAMRLVMEKQVMRDACIDAGDASCAGPDGEVAAGEGTLGYFERTPPRKASVVGIIPGDYSTLSNATFNGENPFIEIDKKQKAVERYVRAYSELQLAMEKVYRGEIQPFLSASDADKAFYNLAPPVKQSLKASYKPIERKDELVRIASQWAKKLRPKDNALGAGASVREVVDKIEDCFIEASKNLNHDCWSQGDPRSQPDWERLDGILKDYRDRGRIVRMQVRIGLTSKGGLDAAKSCANQGSTQDPYEVPSYEQVESLGVLVASGPVPFHQTWVRKYDKECPDEKNPYPVLRYQKEAERDYRCGDENLHLTPVCVAASGLFPALEDPSQLPDEDE